MALLSLCLDIVDDIVVVLYLYSVKLLPLLSDAFIFLLCYHSWRIKINILAHEARSCEAVGSTAPCCCNVNVTHCKCRFIRLSESNNH